MRLKVGDIARIYQYGSYATCPAGIQWWAVVTALVYDDYAEVLFLGESPVNYPDGHLVGRSEDQFEIVPPAELPDHVWTALAEQALLGEST